MNIPNVWVCNYRITRYARVNILHKGVAFDFISSDYLFPLCILCPCRIDYLIRFFKFFISNENISSHVLQERFSKFKTKLLFTFSRGKGDDLFPISPSDNLSKSAIRGYSYFSLIRNGSIKLFFVINFLNIHFGINAYPLLPTEKAGDSAFSSAIR